MEDRRSSHRWETSEYHQKKETGSFRVIDITNNNSIGHLADISAEGMRIISDYSLEKDTVYKLRIDLPEEICGCDQLNVDAKNIWCRQDSKSKQYQSGFEFLSTFPHHAEVIELLFHDLVTTLPTE